MDARLAFEAYQEGPIFFRPTYRYDVGTDNYDTSEKLRIPAWTGASEAPMLTLSPRPTLLNNQCTDVWQWWMGLTAVDVDRILFRGSQLDLSVYSRADLRGSDHRPG